VKTERDDMKCPKCGRFELREGKEGVTCRVCGETLSPGQADRFRLYKLLREESKSERSRGPRSQGV
jgi:ribosomal protein L37AE/L43A